jgi:hypothetical protein
MEEGLLPPEIDQQVENEKDRELLNRVALGEDFERFIRSHLGRHLVTRAERERTELLEKLATHSVFDQNGLVKLQQRIAVLDCWQHWIAEAVTEGVLAEKEFIARSEG